MGEILVRNAWHVATLADDGERLTNADILLQDGRIAAIGAELTRQHPVDPTVAREVIDASRCLALPGLVNTHHHLYQTLQRNIPSAQNATLFDWLAQLYEVWRHLDAEAVYWSTLLGCSELLLTGCTTTSDHHYLFPHDAPAELLDAQLEAAEQIGIRFHASRGSMSRGHTLGGLPPDDVVQDEDAILLDCERVLDRWHDARPLAMRRIVLAPCSPFSVTESLLRATRQLARARGVHCHTHLAETEDENTYCLEHYGRRPLQLMDDLDWLGPDVWFAHGVWFNAEEMARLAETGTGVAHCPTSNMRLGSGIAPLRQLLEHGVPVGLGVDGSASNDSSNMLGEVRQAMLLARVADGADAMDADTVLRLATRGSARVLGRADEIGSLEVGKAADLVLIDLDRLDLAGALSDPLAAVIFSGITQRVHTTIVNGRVVVRDGCLVGIDESEIARRARQLSSQMLERAGQPPAFGTPEW